MNNNVDVCCCIHVSICVCLYCVFLCIGLYLYASLYVYASLELEFSNPSDKIWMHHSLSVYLLCCIQFLDANGIMLMLFDPIDAQQLSRDSTVLLFAADDTVCIKQDLSESIYLFLILGKWEKQ